MGRKEFTDRVFSFVSAEGPIADLVRTRFAPVVLARATALGPVREFLTGWMISPESREVWGRPVGLLQMPDGSVLVSDDGGKKVWRISYRGK